MNRFIVAFVLMLAGVSSAACGKQQSSPPPQPSESEQMILFQNTLEKTKGFTIDTLADSSGKPIVDGNKKPVRNAGWESEGNKRIAEVVVVIAGNCKAQMELVKDTPRSSYYLDEVYDNSGKEKDPDSKFNSNAPSAQDMQRYFDGHKKDFGYCYNKPYAPSKKQ